jgi:hypothetical protein
MWQEIQNCAREAQCGRKYEIAQGKHNVAGNPKLRKGSTMWQEIQNCAREAQCSRKLREGSVTWQEIARGKHNVADKLHEGSAKGTRQACMVRKGLYMVHEC